MKLLNVCKSYSYHLLILLSVFLMSAVVTQAAWTAPASTPPNGNVDAPINVGTVNQIKNGGFGANSLAIYGNSYVEGNLGIGLATPAYKLDVSGTARATAFLYTSDKTQKQNIKTITNPIEIIQKLRGVTFNWKQSNRPDLGVIAQEVEEVLPELVQTDPHTGLKSVEYANLVAPLIEAVKAQQQEITDLNTKLNNLETRLSALESN